MTRGWVPEPPPKTGGLAAAKQWLASRIKPPVSRPRHAADHATVKPALVAQAVAKHVPVASVAQAKNTMEHLVDELLGMGPLAPFARNPDVTDIIVDGHGRIWTDTGTGLDRTDTILEAKTTRDLAVRLLGQGGKRLDEEIGRAHV